MMASQDIALYLFTLAAKDSDQWIATKDKYTAYEGE